MSHQTILIIRHAEKPVGGGDNGVDAAGSSNAKSLTPRGWQRAGAWASLFAPALGQRPVLPRPTVIFASAPAKHGELAKGVDGSKCRRPLETVAPLAAAISIDVDLSFTKGMERELAETISKSEGVVLVSWQHEHVVAICRALAPTAHGVPHTWPDDRFNILFRFDRADADSGWIFEQIAPVMLAGDSSRPI